MIGWAKIFMKFWSEKFLISPEPKIWIGLINGTWWWGSNLYLIIELIFWLFWTYFFSLNHPSWFIYMNSNNMICILLWIVTTTYWSNLFKKLIRNSIPISASLSVHSLKFHFLSADCWLHFFITRISVGGV